MNPRCSPSASSVAFRRRQRGVYALEWAIIFPVFFMLLYAIISFGLTFLVRESMQSAVEDGARAALRYQPQRDARMLAAKTLVIQRLEWLPAPLQPSIDSIQASVCRVDPPDNCSPTLICGTEKDERCMIRLNLTIPYGQSPLLPGLSMLGMQLLNPSELTASATIFVDQGGI